MSDAGSDFRIGSYVIVAQLSDHPAYRDFEAQHAVMGHSVLLRQEKWPSGRSQHPDRQLNVRALCRARRLQAELRHPRILKVLDFLEVDGEWFTVFERAGSPTLGACVQSVREGGRRPLRIDEYVRTCAGLTDALAAIHGAGYVHRTLGIHNVLITGDCDSIMTDLGCALPISADHAETKIARSALNPSTAAPEQYQDALTFTPATDLWSLGVILYYLRYQCFPHRAGADSSLAAVAFAILHEPLTFPPPPRVAPSDGLPAHPETDATHVYFADDAEEALLQPWLVRLLERDPTRRYQDAREVHRDLEAIAAQLEGRPAVATAFVAMPFAAEFDGLWRMIMSACLASRVKAVRVDQTLINESIWEEIRERIEAADLLIAVASPHRGGVPNANVMLEIGYVRALRRPVVLLTNDPTTLPFDLRTQRALVYQPGAEHEPRLHQHLCVLLKALTWKH